MGKTMSLNTQIRPQLLVGLALGIWLYLFLVLVAPFDAAELSFRIRTILMLGYGLVFFLCYALIIPIQKKLYKYLGKWNLSHELAMVSLFLIYCLPVTFGYYKTEIVNGDFGFGEFTLTTYLPICAILLPAVFAGRYLVGRHQSAEERPFQEASITLSGDNKLDILKLKMTDLVALEAANNYVTVYHLLDGQLQKKLLRISLRKIHEAVPDMVQVHRSYLINLMHFVELKDSRTLVLTQLVVPVSQKYKTTLLSLSSFVPK